MISVNPILTLPVTSASGLVRMGNVLYVIADDENSLLKIEDGKFSKIVLFDDVLPTEKKERKKRKPDFEALCLVDERTLLAFPSGSRENRYRGAKIDLATETVTQVDFTELFKKLREKLDPPNIEAVVVHVDSVWLFHRGNKKGHANVVVTLSSLAATEISSWLPIDLGFFDGVPFSITDACVLDDSRVLVTAVAEATEDSFEDGACKASGLGILNRDFTIASFTRFDPAKKFEGICARRETKGTRLSLVNDEDDVSHKSQLFEGFLND